jgi:chromosome partitioning protein
MAFEGIPLNWEMLSLVAGVGAAGAGGAWKICQFLSRVQLRELEAKLAFHAHRSETQTTDLQKSQLTIDRQKDRIRDQETLITNLEADLKNGSGETGARTIEELHTRVRSFDQLRDALLGNEDEVWKLRNTQAPADFLRRMKESRLKVITVVNYKGGVGKTTIVAGLAAYLSKKRKRVLIIDFDYQGSLTRMMVLGARLALGDSIRSDAVIAGEIDGKGLVQLGRDLGATLPGTSLITCGQSFDGFEYRTMLRWLLGETRDDVRFRLADLLLSEAAQKEYDYVLIDAPPRASTGAINALCASHALVIPTVLDSLSVDAVASFLTRASTTFRPLNPCLDFAGIVGTLTKQARLNDVERRAFEEARLALSYWAGRSHLFESKLRHFTALSRAAGRDIGYLEDAGVRRAFDAIGDELIGQLSA